MSVSASASASAFAPLQAVLLDWAGTAVDHGCQGPMAVFVALFERRGLPVSAAEARAPMGTHKREHIRRMLDGTALGAAWEARFGHAATAAEVDALYAEAEPLQIAVLPAHAAPIPGAREAVATLRAHGLRVGSTTGYTLPMLEVLRVAAAEKGYFPDVAVAASEVAAGRPAPDLNAEALRRLGLSDPARAVAVGDTPVDMAAARAAGNWAVGCALTGNELGLDLAGLLALSPAARAEARDTAAARLRAAGAHVVIDGIGELPDALRVLAARARAGERP
jgi:phosphonoacetaldehyde hydrolase